MNNKQIELPIEKCFKQFDQSFNRVKYFSCVMDNLNVEMLPKEWGIKGESGINHDVKVPEDKQYIVDGCKHFMQRYLVRDCIESFALCLDELFFLLLLNGKRIASNKTLMDALSEEEKGYLKRFQDAGLFGKIEKLENQFGLRLPTKSKQIITSLKDIRNCFSHHNGIVRETDGQKDSKGKRKFCWFAFDIFQVGEQSGKKSAVVFNKKFEEPVNIYLQIKQHFKSFNIGENLSFSSAESYEIAWSLWRVASELQKIIKTDILPNNKTHTREIA